MAVSFELGFWHILLLTLNFCLAVYSISSSRGRASAQQLDDYKEKVNNTFIRMGERLQTLETHQINSIDHEDLAAVHKRVDELHRIMTQIGQSVSRVEGLLEGMKGKFHP